MSNLTAKWEVGEQRNKNTVFTVITSVQNAISQVIGMKKITYLMVLCAVSLLVGRSDAKEPSSESRNPSSSRGYITVQGCVAKSTGYYILMRTEPGNTYNLEEGSRTIKLDSYLGEQVEVTGWESPQLSNSSSVFYSTAPSAVTVMVMSIKTLAERCTEGEISASAGSSLVSGAELDLSSTPPDAEIEIDGNFRGPHDIYCGCVGR